MFAFARTAADRAALTIVPRLVASLTPDAPAPPIGATVWGDTRIGLDALASGSRRFRDVFTGAVIEPETIDGSPAIPVAAALNRMPVAILLPA